MTDVGTKGKGMLLGAALTILGLAAVGIVYLPALIAFGVFQYIWMMPVYVMYNYRGEPETAKGVLIASCIGLVLSAVFWGLTATGGFQPFG